jgi:hypothetical protein
MSSPHSAGHDITEHDETSSQYGPVSKYTHRSPLFRGTPLEITLMVISFPISRCAIISQSCIIPAGQGFVGCWWPWRHVQNKGQVRRTRRKFTINFSLILTRCFFHPRAEFLWTLSVIPSLIIRQDDSVEITISKGIGTYSSAVCRTLHVVASTWPWRLYNIFNDFDLTSKSQSARNVKFAGVS